MKYITREGTEVSLTSLEECTRAVREGRLTAHSLVHEEATGRWVQAGLHPEYAILFHPVSPSTRVPPLLRWGSRLGWLLAFTVPPAIAGWAGRNVPFVVGEVVGMAMAVGLLGLLAALVIKNPIGRTGVALAVAVGLLAIEIPYQLHQNQLQRVEQQQLKAAATRLQSAAEASAAADSPASSGGAASSVTPASSTPDTLETPAASSTGDSEAPAVTWLMNEASDFITAGSALNQAYAAKIQSYHLDRILAPEHLLSARELKAGRGVLNQWEQSMRDLESQGDQLVAQFRARVQAGPVSQELKDSYLSHFDAGLRRAEESRRAVLRIDRELLREVRGIYDFMQDRVGLVERQGDLLIFATTADQTAYNEAVARVRALGAEESVAVKAQTAAQQKARQRLQEFAHETAVGEP